MKVMGCVVLCFIHILLLTKPFFVHANESAATLVTTKRPQVTEPLTVGLDADMSAVAVEGGEAIRRGAQIAIDEINATGGVLGRPLALVVKDHRGNPARGKHNIKQFAKLPNLIAVLGGVHTPVALEELSLIHKNRLIYLDPWAAGTPIVDNGYSPNYVFRVSVRDAEAGKVMLAHAKSLDISNVALLLERTGWGRSNERSMMAAAEKQGITISTVVWVNWRQKNMRDEIQTIARSKAEAIILVANAPEGAVAIKAMQLNEETKNMPVISHWGLAGGNFVNQVGLETLSKINMAVLQTFSFTHSRSDAKKRSVFQSYKNKFDSAVVPESIPGAVGVAHAYDLLHLLRMAVENAQSTDSEEVRVALENIKDYKGLVKHYRPPFTEDQHDALMAEDYIMSSYNQEGYLVPIKAME